MDEYRYAKLSAKELQDAIDRAAYYAENSGPELYLALTEIARLRVICQDIIDLVNCSPKSAYLQGGVSELDSCELLDKINDVAHGYYLPICQRP